MNKKSCFILYQTKNKCLICPIFQSGVTQNYLYLILFGFKITWDSVLTLLGAANRIGNDRIFAWHSRLKLSPEAQDIHPGNPMLRAG
jgi:hypothetical protein